MSDNTPANKPSEPAKPQTSVQTAAAVAAANGVDLSAKPPKEYPAKAYVRSKVGRMVHLFTNEVVDERAAKIEIDAFARAQLDAGKWEIVTD
jgi:hypothetical protein